jgi:hypothetical protein
MDNTIIHKKCNDEERSGSNLQRAGGWCEPVRRPFGVSLPSMCPKWRECAKVVSHV